MGLLLDLLFLLALVFYSPVLLWRMLVVGKDRHGLAERLGRIPRRESAGPLIWIHAVSVGEVNATAVLAGELGRCLPDHELAFSTTTDTGSARLAQLYPEAIRIRYPLDFSRVVSRVIRRLRPNMIVLMELEVWPNLLRLARRLGIPVVVVNGRLSERSFAWYRRVRAAVRPMFARLAGVCAQDATYAQRFVALGTPADRAVVTGSMKYDTAAVMDRVPGQEALAETMGLDPSCRLLVAGSTGPGEEEILLRVYQPLRGCHPLLRLAIVPRKPERFDEVAELIARRGFDCRRRSRHPDGAAPPGSLSADTIVLGDTMGELRKFYSLAELIFVGRTLVPMGGSDVMEAAALRKPVLVGPHTENFAEPVARLASAGGLRVVPADRDGDGLRTAVDELLTDPPARQAMAAAARQTVLDAQGATRRTVEFLCGLLGRRT